MLFPATILSLLAASTLTGATPLADLVKRQETSTDPAVVSSSTVPPDTVPTTTASTPAAPAASSTVPSGTAPSGAPSNGTDSAGAIQTGFATINPNPTGAKGGCSSSEPGPSVPPAGWDFTDSGLFAALSPSWMGSGWPHQYCGRKLVATNVGNQGDPSADQSIGGKGSVVTMTVADLCVGCDAGHIDISQEAWKQLTNGAVDSTTNITWHFCDENGNC